MQSMLGSSLLNAAAGLLSLVAGFGSSVIVARLLGVEGAGIVAYALWIMTVATLLSDFGMPQAVLRFIGKDDVAEGAILVVLRTLSWS
jgi:O-antigen/teichoic acid export membrane protein